MADRPGLYDTWRAAGTAGESAAALPSEVPDMSDLVMILIAVVALLLFDLAAMRYGADSRGSFDSEQFRIPRG